ncbi:MAG: 16S rRNA (uracil(1498)-N(3))-methyltransferase [Oscillatoriales cyanobacterium C42_A2020_001]|nr:16S rRNA (uracil(1498)-N(3))-methyltransferase [Leptolyngbyaceae cyanobacterium C42_A2020_001]
MLQRLVIDPARIQSPTIWLTADQHHYLTRVLRLKAGDHFVAMDGQGHSWLVTLELTHPPQASIVETVEVQTELPIAITLVVALPKGNTLDDVVRQATELGVSCIAPVISDRTLLNPSSQKLERWRRIAQEAAEQSERQQVPTILEPIAFTDHLQKVAQSSLASPHYLCATRHNAPHLLPLLSSHSYPPPALSIAIGPEGGWTEPELNDAIAAGYQPVSLGSRILRAVTAPIVALSMIVAVYEGGMVGQRE